MKHLTIIVPNGENNLSSIVGAYKIFSRANAYQKEVGKKEVFKIELAGITDEVDFYGGLFTARLHKHISAIGKTDLVIIPSLNHNYEQTIKANGELIDWIGKQYRHGAEEGNRPFAYRLSGQVQQGCGKTSFTLKSCYLLLNVCYSVLMGNYVNHHIIIS
jgi:hypothetical protein